MRKGVESEAREEEVDRGGVDGSRRGVGEDAPVVEMAQISQQASTYDDGEQMEGWSGQVLVVG